MILARFRASWNDFFFKPIDPGPISIFRILFGLLVVINGLMIWPDLPVWYGEKGVLPLAAALNMTGGHRLDILALLPSSNSWLVGFFCFHILAAVFLTLGFYTRISALAVFISIVSFHHRNILILNSGDTLIRVVSFLLIFSQAGSAFSLDWIWRVIKGVQEPLREFSSPWAQRLIQIQLCIVYVFTVMWKLKGSAWVDGTAVYYTSRLEEFQRFPVPWLFENLILIKLITWITLVIELSIGTLVWLPRLRPYILCLALFLHLGLEYSMNVPLFQWIMLTTLILFIEPNWLRTWVLGLKKSTKKLFKNPVPVFYDGTCIFCVRTSAILRAMDILGRLQLLNFRSSRIRGSFPDFDPIRAEKEMALYTGTGKWLYGYEAFRYITRQIPTLWPVSVFMFLPGVSMVGRRVYAWVSKNRFFILGGSCSEEPNSVCRIPSDGN